MTMRTVTVPLSLALDRTASANLIALSVALATAVDEDGFVRESQTSLAKRLQLTQEEVVGLLANMKARGLIVVSQDDMGMLYQLAWIERRSTKIAARRRRFQWVQVVERGHKNPSWMQIEDAPEDVDLLKAWLEGKGHQFIQVQAPSAPKAPS